MIIVSVEVKLRSLRFIFGDTFKTRWTHIHTRAHIISPFLSLSLSLLMPYSTLVKNTFPMPKIEVRVFFILFYFDSYYVAVEKFSFLCVF